MYEYTVTFLLPGKVHGAIVPLDAEDQVHFKFPVLSSDPKSKNFEYFSQRAE